MIRVDLLLISYLARFFHPGYPSLSNMYCALQLVFQMRTFSTLEDPILPQRFTTMNTLMLAYVDLKSGESHWPSF